MNNVDQVLIALRRVIRAADLHSRQLIKCSGLTTPQILLLQALKQDGEMPVGALAQRINLSQATVTTILDRMEKKNLVRRVRSQRDKRKVYINLTDDGVTTLRDAPMPLQSSFINQFEALADWEQSLIMSALQRVAHMMDADSIDASPYLEIGALDRSWDDAVN